MQSLHLWSSEPPYDVSAFVALPPPKLKHPHQPPMAYVACTSAIFFPPDNSVLFAEIPGWLHAQRHPDVCERARRQTLDRGEVIGCVSSWASGVW